VVQELAASVVAVDGDDDVRPGAVDAVRERLRGEAREHLGVGAPMRAHESIVTGRDGNIGRWQVTTSSSSTSTSLSTAAILVDPVVQVLVRDVLALVGVGPLPDEGGLVLAFVEVAVDAVVGGVQLPAREPLVKRRVRVVEHLVPVFVPLQEAGVLLETLRIVLVEPLVDPGSVTFAWPTNDVGGRKYSCSVSRDSSSASASTSASSLITDRPCPRVSVRYGHPVGRPMITLHVCCGPCRVTCWHRTCETCRRTLLR